MLVRSNGTEIATNPMVMDVTTPLSATTDGTGVTTVTLGSGYTPSHVVVAAGEFTTAGGDTDETITVSGVVATDLCHVTLHTAGVSPVTVIDAACGTGQIDVDMSADPSTDHVLTYSVLRAVS